MRFALFSLFLALALVARGQLALPLQLQNDFRNEFRQAPGSGTATYPPTASNLVNGVGATAGQFKSGSTFGGWRTTRITGAGGTVLAGATSTSTGATGVYKYPTNGTLRLVGVSMGRHLVVSAVSIPLGSVIPPPSFAADGTPVGPDYYLAKPENAQIDDPLHPGTKIANPDFYYSRHARQVYGTNLGRIAIIWKETVARAVPGVNGGLPTQQTNTQYYFVSSSPVKPPQTIYWTEGTFNGPNVATPASVNDVQIVYNRLLTATATTYLSPTGAPAPINANTNQPETRTLWWDSAQKVFHAYNLDGRIFVEYLGALQGDPADPQARRQLGFELVDVRQEVAPSRLNVALGDSIDPVADVRDSATGTLSVDSSLVPTAVTGTEFLYRKSNQVGTILKYYAEKQALSGAFGDQVLIYWRQAGVLDILWPRQYVGYNLDWPASDPANVAKYYSIFARPDSSTPDGAAASKATGVPLDSNNIPSLVYQDDPLGKQAVMAPGNIFYTNVTPDSPTNRALILYDNQTDVWFERVYSELDTHNLSRRQVSGVLGGGGTLSTGFTSITDVVVTDTVTGATYVLGVDYTINPATGLITKINGGGLGTNLTVSFNFPIANLPLISKEVGQRIEPDVAGAEPMVGYIWQPAGTAFNPEAYLNPFVVTFDAASKGAIIGVNALSGNNQLEVWWYKKSHPPVGSTITGTPWPQFVERYQLTWPAVSDSIVLASNAGSGDLPSLQAAGKIYYQNDATKPGFNPNEEHAVLISGRAWALRDDLNVAVSSAPYVLLSYTDADQRPSMRVFQVLREDATHNFNRIPEVAGVALQRPLPLTILPLPIKADGTVQNYEVDPLTYPDDPLPAFDATRDAGYEAYRKFTYTDRKGTAWIYRGPHGGNLANPALGPTFSMRYFYVTQAGFYYPGLATQPNVGTITPYLRPYTNSVDASGGFEGDAVTGAIAGDTRPHSLNITYAPVWPDAVPELNVAETLTLPKAGLPQVRGASSAQLIYQQSIARAIDVKQPSARLHDPTVAKKTALSAVAGQLAAIPGSVKTSTLLGKTYFPNLPPHLIQRFYFDPADGAKGSLVLKGTFQNELVGEKYLLLNVLGSDDLATLQNLCSSTDLKKTDWNTAVANLQVTLSTFKEDPSQRGTFIPDSTKNKVVGLGALAEITSQETAHDSYAVTADGGGTGYVVMVTEDGRAFTPEGNQPSVSIFKVSYPPLYRGQLKTLNPSNPLDDQVTVQHTGDFAGHPEGYEFQWIYASGASGIPPEIQTKSALTVLGAEVAGSLDQWTLVNNPGSDYQKYRGVLGTTGTVTIPPAGKTLVINNGQGTSANGATIPNAILRKEFSAPTVSGTVLDTLVSVDLGTHDGAKIYLNGALVATWNVPGEANSPTASAPAVTSGHTPFAPQSLVFEAPAALLHNVNVLDLELYTDADANASTTVNARIEALVGQDAAYPPNASWIALDPTAVTGKSRHLVHGPGLLTLGDYYYSLRYRALPPASGQPASAAYNATAFAANGGWSPWVEPQLVEGWIKRSLNGINPFNQRISDLFNNPVDTSVSLVQQAGKRWEGDISLSLDNINNVGLIEIYETILHHGEDLSINGGFNDPGANDALVLAAGYLRDLYMVLGDDAYADAANPTIAFSTETSPNFITQYGDVATSLFAFKGQVATLMDEELGLLRGRDDLLPPKNRTAPVYNRLYWNYTRGIDSGEAVYALNYNIKDVAWDYTIKANNATNAVNDGVISAADAATLYPQGHGDAYGHYLTALTGYYQLLSNPNYSWAPHTEAVTILGQPVLVGYLHERKFAGAAAALARTASQILDLTYRKAFTSSTNAGWGNLRDAQEATKGRNWGVDDWACRGGQGAYFSWVTANSLLPDVDPDPSHEGIQKIDRTTVPELAEIVAQANAVQKTLDNADERLNPLGLSRGTLSFDISPTEVDAGKTHYEQLYGRAVVALQNAVTAFNNAKGSTQFLRQQEDTLETQRNAIAEQEQAYTNQLVDLYGTPYSDDIGPGKTYAQDYVGPDLLHSAYVETPEIFRSNLSSKQTTFVLPIAPQIAAAASDTSAPTLDSTSSTVSYTFNEVGIPEKPAAWTGHRVRPGQMQSDVSSVLSARLQVISAIRDYNLAGSDLANYMAYVQANYSAHSKNLDERFSHGVAIATLQGVIGALQILEAVYAGTAQTSLLLADAAAEGFPHVIGLANDATSVGRAGVKLAGIAGWEAAGGVAGGAKLAQGLLAAAVAVTQADLDSKLRGLAWDSEEAQMLYNLKTALDKQMGKQTAIDTALRSLDDATRRLQTTVAQGDRILSERTTFRQRSAAIIQGYRTRDFAFRAFRDEALEKYKTLFDLAARYTFLASRAYDYETGLLDPNNSTAGSFFDKIVAARALGVVTNGQPQFAGSTNGDPGLSGILAEMNGDWSVAKTRLGFNNPDRYRTDFSLRQELYRILPGTEGDLAWQDKLGKSQMTNILDDPDVKRYCLQAGDTSGLAVPGFVIPFQTTIAQGYNFFGLPLAGGDHTFSPTSFATKIRSSGIAFTGYVGMDAPTTTNATLNGIGATSPSSPGTGFSDPQSLSATPYIYLIPAGVDSMRSPPLGDTSTVRTWQVQDQAIPLPFNIGNSDYSSNAAWTSADSLSEPAFAIRKHQAFRAVPTGTNFPSDPGFTNARLIGRSVWNSEWKIVIPGNTLLNDPAKGAQIFLSTVKDIRLHLESYSYSGN